MWRRSKKPQKKIKVPQITALTPQKKDPSRVSLYLDGRFVFGLNRSLVSQAKLVIGQEISAETVADLRGQSEEEKILNLVYRFLSYRPRSEKEVSDYLTKKKISQKMIARVIVRLKSQGYLNDEEFALWWLDQRQRFRPRSRYFLKSELTKKGVGVEVVDRVLANVDEEALIEKIILDKKSWLTGLEPNKAKEKLIAYLSRRGFSWEKIRLGLEKSDLFD